MTDNSNIENEIVEQPGPALDGGIIGAGGALEDGGHAAPAPAQTGPTETRTEPQANHAQPAATAGPAPARELEQSAELELRGRLTELEHKHNAAVDALSGRAAFAVTVAAGALILAAGLYVLLRRAGLLGGVE